MHFGRFLTQLRTDRGLSQVRLAEKAGVSDFTISKGETSAACPWRRSTATDVFEALDRSVPLTKHEAATFFQMAKMEALSRAAAAEGERRRPEIEAAARLAAAAREPADADSMTAHDWVERLIEERGARRVLDMLEGLAAGLTIDLPPRRAAADPTKKGRWIHHEEWEQEGVRVRRLTPIDPAAPQKQLPRRAEPKRRTGA